MVYVPRGFISIREALARLEKMRRLANSAAGQDQEAESPISSPTREEFRQELWQALGEGDLPAWGQSDRTGKRVRIAGRVWRTAQGPDMMAGGKAKLYPHPKYLTSYDSHPWQVLVSETNFLHWAANSGSTPPMQQPESAAPAQQPASPGNHSQFEDARLQPTSETTYRTGAAGRPTSSHLVLDELNRRRAAGETCATLAQEARELVTWLRATHPGAAPLSPATAENTIRDAYRLARKSSNQAGSNP